MKRNRVDPDRRIVRFVTGLVDGIVIFPPMSNRIEPIEKPPVLRIFANGYRTQKDTPSFSEVAFAHAGSHRGVKSGAINHPKALAILIENDPEITLRSNARYV